MNKFFARNLDAKGRLARAMFGLALIGVGLLVFAQSRWLCLAMVLGGGFALYEAGRGWCVMRACGIKTRL